MNFRKLASLGLLVFVSGALVAMGNPEVSYSFNGIPYYLDGSTLVDEDEGLPLDDSPTPGRQRFYAGGSSVARTLFRMAEVIDAETRGESSDYGFEPLGSGLAYRGVLTGHLDWAGGSRSLFLGEKAQGLVETPMAWDTLQVIVSPDLGVAGVTVAQLAAMIVGEIRNWSEVGGPDLPVVPFVFSERSGLAGAIRELVLEPIYGDDGLPGSSAVFLNYDGEVFTRVARTPGAFGFALGSYEDSRGNVPLKFLPLHGYEPTPEAVAMGRYPLARPVLMVTLGPPQGRAADLLELILSPRLQSALPRMNLVPVQ